MKTEKQIREAIKKTVASFQHVLDCGPATIGINAPRAIMQIEAKSRLDGLYWSLGEERPRFLCDDFSKKDR